MTVWKTAITRAFLNRKYPETLKAQDYWTEGVVELYSSCVMDPISAVAGA
ncbi:MAG: hypothetical protein PHC92_09875 [Syntrophomonadaceae bacterium]|nr:hypothetical protein [Syntrophomonadaceae bacterium]MDD3023823.1 hypothetical protein [Syntrophomonadaceae bacterium]